MSAEYSNSGGISQGAGENQEQNPMTAYQFNTPFEQQQHIELNARKRLVGGVPRDAPSCNYHRDILAGLLKQHSNDNKDYVISTSDPLFTFAKRFEQTITSQTALLPFCSTCTRKAMGLEADQPVPIVDMCLCATYIAFSKCWFCEVARLQAAKNTVIAQNRRRVPNTTKHILQCACGNVGKQEEARQCAACLGIVAAPFKNMAGLQIVFHPHTPWVGALLGPQTQPQQTLPFLNLEGMVRQPPPAPSGQVGEAKTSVAPNVERAPVQQGERDTSALLAGPIAVAQTDDGRARVNSVSLAQTPVPSELPFRQNVSAADWERMLNKENNQSILGDVRQERSAHASALRETSQPVFVHEEIQKIQDLFLECDSFSYEVGRPPTGPERAQLVLKLNGSTYISSNTLIEMFKLCGLHDDELAKVMEHVNGMGNVMGDDVAIAMWMALRGVPDEGT